MNESSNKLQNNPDSIKRFKRDQEQQNPCWTEHNLSLKCLNNNNYDYDKCQLYFENYKFCKKFWGKVISERRLHDIKPWVPLPEDREKVKEEYIKSRKRY